MTVQTRTKGVLSQMASEFMKATPLQNSKEGKQSPSVAEAGAAGGQAGSPGARKSARQTSHAANSLGVHLLASEVCFQHDFPESSVYVAGSICIYCGIL